jgi:hypothetical protein
VYNVSRKAAPTETSPGRGADQLLVLKYETVMSGRFALFRLVVSSQSGRAGLGETKLTVTLQKCSIEEQKSASWIVSSYANIMNILLTWLTIDSNQEPRQPGNPTRDDPCISPVSLSPVSTYVDRPALSKEIRTKMAKSCGNKSLVHALAVTGLGGTGKTQLVLHYIEQHKQKYDTILWIDALDEASVRSSFVRCCNALSIYFEREQNSGPVYDASSVQDLQQWLASRAEYQKWLVVLDNAGTFDHLNRIVPWNKSAGSVAVTSQDGKAAKVFPGARTLVIDKMEIEEAKTLLAQCMIISLPGAHCEAMSLLEEGVHRLDGIALAIELAGAHIQNDLNIGDDGQKADASERVVAGLKQYIVDLEHHKKSVLSDSAHNDASSYK